jgi:UDP-3-O-[3-hydroxymyristoyl] glucosamine N-acyltransferase
LKLTLREIAAYVDGKVIGEPDINVSGVSEIQNSLPGTITFLGNPKYKQFLIETQAEAIFVSNEDHLNGKNGIVVSNPQSAMARTLRLFFPKKSFEPSIHESAVIDSTVSVGKNIFIDAGVVIKSGASIGDNSIIGANVVIGNRAAIGTHCSLKPNVTIYHNVIIGDNCIIHSGAAIGCDGFGYVTENKSHEKIPQTGNVVIGNDVEIGSNCAIDRATIGVTSIGDMTKIDNLVHIAHNVKVGKGCLITAGFAVAGSTEIGDYCTFAGQVGIAPHVKIGSNSVFAAKSGVTKSLKGGKVYAGFPAREIREHNKKEAQLHDITRMSQKLDQLLQDRKKG